MKIIEEQTTDEVLKETRRIKEALGKRFDFDIDRIIDFAIENSCIFHSLLRYIICIFTAVNLLKIVSHFKK